MADTAKIAALVVIGCLAAPVAIVWLLCTAWCFTLGHVGRIICDCGESNAEG